jgi:hypothetical protein
MVDDLNLAIAALDSARRRRADPARWLVEKFLAAPVTPTGGVAAPAPGDGRGRRLRIIDDPQLWRSGREGRPTVGADVGADRDAMPELERCWRARQGVCLAR